MIQQGGVQGVVLRVVLGGVGNVLPHQGDGTLQEMGLHAVEVFQEMVLGVLQQKEEKHLQMAQGRIQREEVHMLAETQISAMNHAAHKYFENKYCFCCYM